MKKTKKQIAAIVGIVLLVLLYFLTLIFAIFDFEGSDIMFRGCLLGTIVIPIFIWIYMYLYGKLVQNRDGNGVESDVTLHK